MVCLDVTTQIISVLRYKSLESSCTKHKFNPVEATELFDTDSDAIKKYSDTDIWKLQSLAEHCNLHSDYSIMCGVISFYPPCFKAFLKSMKETK